MALEVTKKKEMDQIISDKYKKLNPQEHVLTRPGMYIGSIEEDITNMWIVNDDSKMIKKSIKYIPGLYKIVDEILVNTIDHAVRMKCEKEDGKDVGLVKNIYVNIDKETGIFEISNDGQGIEIVKHPEHNIYIPELIFGNMLTSTNYNDTDEKIIGGQNGIGAKCLSLDTKVPLFNGEIKIAKNINIGDILIGDDGNKRTVLNVTLGNGKMYEIIQTMGETYKVNDDHILTLHMPDHKVIFWNTNGWKILWWDNKQNTIKSHFIKAINTNVKCDACDTILNSNIKRHYSRCHPDKRNLPIKTADMNNENIKTTLNEMQNFMKSIDDNNIIDMSIKNYLKLSKTTQSRLAGLRGNCVNWDYTSVELDPYVLGLWLGDGTHNGYSYTCDDPELINYLIEWGKNNDAPLKKYNLVSNKHIPKEYIINSREVRLNVLAGVIDTDCTVSRNETRIVITQCEKHKILIYDLLYLARSLGFYCSIKKFKAKYIWKGEERQSDAFKLNISGNIDDIPTKLPRKKCMSTKIKDTDKSTGQLKINEIENGDYIGFEIDENQRFLVNDFTVTHNCANIFSLKFEVETVDYISKMHYHQIFENNMSIVHPPKIEKYKKKPDITTIIRFKPDYQRLNMKDSLTDDMYDVIIKRVYDTCAVTDNDVNIYLNDVKLEYKNFEKYIDLFLGPKVEHDRVFERINQRWEVAASYNDFNGFEQMSFVNGLCTIRGGKHVEYICNQIIKKLSDLIVKKNKNVTVKPQSIKDNLILFVKATIVNPAFDSQSKETLTTPVAKFGSKGEISDKFIEKLYKSGIVEKVLELSQLNDAKTLQKTDGKKKNVIRGLPKLEDANWAGTNKSSECILILTEGDSAASMAIAGLSELGRDKYGVFPLKGKILNVRDINITKIADNDEITNLKKIIGLETGKNYKSVNDLRYGKIMLMTDQDCDGFHIRGLLFNLFHIMWPSLLKENNFATALMTPIVKATKGTELIQFYNLADYDRWVKDHNGWNIKYYKGLGTSTADEAVKYFKEMKLINYKYNENTSDDKLELAFDKKKADERKIWLGNFDKNIVLDYKEKEVTYEDFVDKELIHFSNYDVERSIPNMMDGLKISQRKILFCCIKRNLTDKEIKVAQLAAYVSEHSGYHHGEASLQSTIVGMAQDFVGANNINLLKPNGQFGTRQHGGKDAGQPRYIYTLLTNLSTKIFIKDDGNVLKYLNDDGLNIEPEYYMPIIPTIIVNGALGIGTGFSTNIPCYNPKDIIVILKRIMDGDDVSDIEMIPWYNGFNGSIEKINGKYFSRGRFAKASATKIEITELPIGTWTFDFKCLLEDMLDKFPIEIKGYENNSSTTNIKFMITFANSDIVDKYLRVESNGLTKFENDFKLSTSKPLGTTNMYAFNSKCTIEKYDTPVAIIQQFYTVRLEYYQKRKDFLTSKLKYDLDILKNKIRFIKAVVNEDIILHKLKKSELEKRLEKDEYMKHDNNYDYITRIPVYNLTTDKVEDFENDIKKADQKYNDVMAKDIKDTWKEELEALLILLDKHIKSASFKINIKKKIVLK
jgi:DNA topoisomerase-2